MAFKMIVSEIAWTAERGFGDLWNCFLVAFCFVHYFVFFIRRVFRGGFSFSVHFGLIFRPKIFAVEPLQSNIRQPRTGEARQNIFRHL